MADNSRPILCFFLFGAIIPDARATRLSKGLVAAVGLEPTTYGL
jgi:hypothetical protein